MTMDSTKRNISARGKGILSLALAKLEANPPEVAELLGDEMCDAAVYRKTVGDTVVEEMRKRGYKILAPPQWVADFEAHRVLVDRLKRTDANQADFEESLKRAKQCLEAMKIHAEEDLVKSDEEWEDVDTSYSSNKSVSSKGASRNSNMLNAKKSLKQMMQDSAKKGAAHSSTLEQNRSMKLKKNTTSTDLQAQKSDRQQRGVKRQASSVLASDAKKDKKSIEVDKTEFARSQNSRVQLVKERKEMKDKERSEMIRAKIQQKQATTKENKASKQAKTAQKSSTASAKGVKTASISSAAPANQASGVKKSAADKHPSATFLKPVAPPTAIPPTVTAGKILPLDGSFCTENERFSSMQSKAFEDRRHGGLAKQAMYQSILAAGEENRGAINSTFLPGVESKPDFDASLALKGMKDTFVVGSALGATFVSKPGLIQTPKKNPQKDVSFVDSFNETFRDYGLDDLCSDSDNTDDENAPTKPVPKWAELKSARFKDKVSKQRMLGKDITKYGLKDIYMPPSVDLEMIFEEKSNRFDRHDTSSGIWNDTQDFIKH